jgi:hypothetical protein
MKAKSPQPQYSRVRAVCAAAAAERWFAQRGWRSADLAALAIHLGSRQRSER